MAQDRKYHCCILPDAVSSKWWHDLTVKSLWPCIEPSSREKVVVACCGGCVWSCGGKGFIRGGTSLQLMCRFHCKLCVSMTPRCLCYPYLKLLPPPCSCDITSPSPLGWHWPVFSLWVRHPASWNATQRFWHALHHGGAPTQSWQLMACRMLQKNI